MRISFHISGQNFARAFVSSIQPYLPFIRTITKTKNVSLVDIPKEDNEDQTEKEYAGRKRYLRYC